MSSGPRTGFAEIRLPAKQPGSSIMPGKVNPVMVENLAMICYHVIGADTAVAWAASRGQLELNVMMPLMAHEVLESLVAPGQRLPPVRARVRRRHRGRRRALRHAARAVERDGHPAGAVHRLRAGCRYRQGGRRDGQDDPRAGQSTRASSPPTSSTRSSIRTS
jgi:hypothetical protein